MGYKLDDVELYLFNSGESAYSYRAMGCHRVENEAGFAHRFAVWAPHAKRVSVVGDFNGWDTNANAMCARGSTGVWETHINGLDEGTLYKYAIVTPAGKMLYKADPYAFAAEVRPETASKICEIGGYEWSDSAWISKRDKSTPYEKPVSIYEMHVGSWSDASNYREIADRLAEYIVEMGYTHVELMPVSEYPLDDSWGYQVTGYYAVTSRYGSPHDFMYFVDKLHAHGIGVILDWVPAHYPRDAHGLRFFDGLACYEHADPRKGEQPEWGTMLFNYGRGEVQSFLMSNAVFWMDMYHIDGLRVDAVSCMLYLNYAKNDGQWVANKYGGTENLESIEFMRKTSKMIFREFPGALFCAEEATSFPLVTKPDYLGGLGFNYKWNMGWMHDMLEYMSMDPIFRKDHHHKLTFSMFYAFSENFILPISHDEVVHGKRSLLDKMPGDYQQKFANMRAFMAFMYAHPGKKLTFMGSEIGQFIEWRFYEPLEWHLLKYDAHKKLQDFMRALNKLYAKSPAMFEIEDDWSGFEWLSIEDSSRSIITFARYSKPKPKSKDNEKSNQKEEGDLPAQTICCAFNFTPVPRPKYLMGVPRSGTYVEIFNSDLEQFGGTSASNKERRSVAAPCHGKENSIEIDLPPLGAVFMRLREPRKKRD